MLFRSIPSVQLEGMGLGGVVEVTVTDPSIGMSLPEEGFPIIRESVGFGASASFGTRDKEPAPQLMPSDHNAI